ncbi:MAG: tetratricopeptide repeat protein [Candidatus Brocadiae bacterium]|nr:tetratricopeptide repeat protein [Candidatus Brocadiia bacterium]
MLRCIFSILFFLCFLPMSFSQVPEDYTQAFIEASNQEQQKEFFKAIEILKKIEGKYYQDYALHLQMAWLYFQAGAYPEAKGKYKQAILISPDAEQSNLGFAWSCYYLKEYEEAILSFEKVLQKNPENASAKEGMGYSLPAQYKHLLELATELEKQNQYARGIQSLEVLRNRYPKDYTVHLRSAWLSFLGWDYALSEKYYRIALEIAPQDPDATLGLAWCLLYSGKYEESEALFTGFLKQNPKNENAQEGFYRSRSALYEKKGDLLGAARNLDPVVKKYPKEEKLLLHYAWLLFESKNYANAQDAYQSVLDINPKSTDAKVGLAWCLYYQKDWERAQANFQSILEENQDHASAKQGIQAVQFAQTPPPRNINLSASFSFTGLDYDSRHKAKEDGYSFSGNINLTLYQHFTTSLTLRSTDFNVKKDLADIENFDTSEIYLSSGLNFASFGLLLHYVKARDFSDSALREVKAYGLTLRWSDFFGDLSFEPSFSDYEYTSDAQRYSLGWFSPELLPNVHLQLGASHQRTDHKNYWNGSISIYYYTGESLFNAKWLFWIGGRYGDEYKPVYMAGHSIYNMIEEIEYGVNAGVQYNLAKGLKIFMSFEMLALNVDSKRPIIQKINNEDQIVKVPFDFNSYSFSFSIGFSYNFF